MSEPGEAGGDTTEHDEPASPRSVWDEAEDDVAEAGSLWSVRRLVEDDAASTDFSEEAPPTMDGRLWRDAEAALGRELVEAASSFARLDERLRAIGPRAAAAVERLAQAAAVELMRREGEALAPDRLALWLVDREATAEEGWVLARAGWAVRRLSAGPQGLAGSAGVASFLDPRGTADHASLDAAKFELWAARIRALRGAHRLTQAGYALSAWRVAEVSPPGVATEPLVVAMTLAARAGRGGAPFAPLGRHGRAATRVGRPADHLAVWLTEIAKGAEAALLTIERLAEWEARALSGVVDLSGRTPARLIDALARRFALSAQTAAAATDVSVSAAVRNLALLESRGLVREMTGRGRFRIWSARL